METQQPLCEPDQRWSQAASCQGAPALSCLPAPGLSTLCRSLTPAWLLLRARTELHWRARPAGGEDRDERQGEAGDSDPLAIGLASPSSPLGFLPHRCQPVCRVLEAGGEVWELMGGVLWRGTWGTRKGLHGPVPGGV